MAADAGIKLGEAFVEVRADLDPFDAMMDSLPSKAAEKVRKAKATIEAEMARNRAAHASAFDRGDVALAQQLNLEYERMAGKLKAIGNAANKAFADQAVATRAVVAGPAGVMRTAAAGRAARSGGGGAFGGGNLFAAASLLDDLQYVGQNGMGLRPIANNLLMINPQLAILAMLGDQIYRHWDTVGPVLEKAAEAMGLGGLAGAAKEAGNYVSRIPGAFEELMTGQPAGTKARKEAAREAAEKQKQSDAQVVAGLGDAAAEERGSLVGKAIEQAGGGKGIIDRILERELADKESGLSRFDPASRQRVNDEAAIRRRREQLTAMVAGAARGNAADLASLTGMDERLGLSVGAREIEAEGIDQQDAENLRRYRQARAEKRRKAGELANQILSGPLAEKALQGRLSREDVEGALEQAGYDDPGKLRSRGGAVFDALEAERKERARKAALAAGTDLAGGERIVGDQANLEALERQRSLVKAQMDAAGAGQFRSQSLGHDSFRAMLQNAAFDSLGDPLKEQVKKLDRMIELQKEQLAVMKDGGGSPATAG